jgi:hypothetical protein
MPKDDALVAEVNAWLTDAIKTRQPTQFLEQHARDTGTQPLR